MTFESILFARGGGGCEEPEPDYFRDLNLDRVVAAVTAGKEAYDLPPFFYRRLEDADEIAYRQEVMRDLEGPLGERISVFARQMDQVRRQLRTAEESHYRLNGQSWFLSAAGTYSRAVRKLLNDLQHGEPASRGLEGFRDYLAGYTASSPFRMLAVDTEKNRGGARLGALLHAKPGWRGNG
jgi:DNA mismatch repair protein MutS